MKELKQSNAYVTDCAGAALARAKELDARRTRGEALGKLAGIPIAVKDNICMKGAPTTCASRMLENFVPPYHATVVEKLLAEDAIIVGKANMDEFAMGSSSETSYFGTPTNPVDSSRVAGGSSGGSAAAVASSQCYLALGSDTGGSIRQPAAYCGCVGLKPTYGTVSRVGLVAFASSLDQIGPLSRNVDDAALLLEAIAGHDPKESTSLRGAKLPYMDYQNYSLKGKRIAVVKEFLETLEDVEVKASVALARRTLEGFGAELCEVPMPTLQVAIAAYYIIASAECASNLARFDGVKYGYRAKNFSDVTDMYFKTRSSGFGTEVKRRIMLGNFVLSSGYYDAYYLKARKAQTLMKREFDRVFSEFDFILSPTTPTPAFCIGEKVDDPLAMYLNDAYTVPVNIAGIPAVSVPFGTAKGGLPIGIQLMGRMCSEPQLLGAARLLEGKGK